MSWDFAAHGAIAAAQQMHHSLHQLNQRWQAQGIVGD
jgi:hypothetical protein